tara:strand:+ start:55 stop:351 length:297 start_codon:yes stop_codon:yes gene_type:complete
MKIFHNVLASVENFTGIKVGSPNSVTVPSCPSEGDNVSALIHVVFTTAFMIGAFYVWGRCSDRSFFQALLAACCSCCYIVCYAITGFKSYVPPSFAVQ